MEEKVTELLLKLMASLAAPGARTAALDDEAISNTLAPLYDELSTMQQYLSRSLFKRLLNACWAATTAAVDALVLAQSSRYKPLRPEEVGLLERALHVMQADYHAEGAGMPHEQLQASSARTAQLLHLATQPTGDVVQAFLGLMEGLYRSCEEAGRAILPTSRPCSTAGMPESPDSYAADFAAARGSNSSSAQSSSNGRQLKTTSSSKGEGDASGACSPGSAGTRSRSQQQQSLPRRRSTPRSSKDSSQVSSSSSSRQSLDEEEHSPVSRATLAQGTAQLAGEAGKQLTCLDVLRLLRQRRGDIEALTFLAVQLSKAVELVPQVLFGLPPLERVLVMAVCHSPSGPAGQAQQGTMYLFSNHLAFSSALGLPGAKALEELNRPTSKLPSWMPGYKGSKGRHGEQRSIPVPSEPYVPDASLLMPLEAIVRLDKVWVKEREALMATLDNKTSHTFVEFEEGVRDKLVEHVRLHVMGSESPLDKNLRGRAATPAAHSLQLPPGEPPARCRGCALPCCAVAHVMQECHARCAVPAPSSWADCTCAPCPLASGSPAPPQHILLIHPRPRPWPRPCPCTSLECTCRVIP
jgi:hypothetical protein